MARLWLGLLSSPSPRYPPLAADTPEGWEHLFLPFAAVEVISIFSFSSLSPSHPLTASSAHSKSQHRAGWGQDLMVVVAQYLWQQIWFSRVPYFPLPDTFVLTRFGGSFILPRAHNPHTLQMNAEIAVTCIYLIDVAPTRKDWSSRWLTSEEISNF